MPSILIIGAQRCGTTTLFDWLCRSPRARPSRRKELHYFDLHQDRSLRWYRSNFPLRPGGLAITATPSLLYLPDAPERVAATLPRARFVVSLRDPVARAVSGYWHVVGYGGETRGLEEAIWSEPTSITDAYKERGRYAEQLERWFAAVGRDRVSVVFFEDLVADPASTVGGLAADLGLGSVGDRPVHSNQQHYEGAEPAGLREYFRESDEALQGLLGRPLPWRS